MRLLRTIWFYLILIISFFLGTFSVILFSVFDSEEARIIKFQRVAHIWAKVMAWIIGIPVSISGLENLPNNEPLILASNHQGAADILILLACIPLRFTFIVKNELLSVPLFGWYLKKAGYVGVDRGTKRGAVAMLIEATNRLKAGDHILIFPEGARSTDGKLHEFKRGSLLLAFKAKVRIVPIAISGSFEIMPIKTRLITPHPVKVKIGEPMKLEKYHNDSSLANEDLYKTIGEMLLELQK